MRALIFILSLLVITPGFAQGWTSYSNARYGANADVPPGFVAAGPEAKNSDGLIFRSRQGGYLTIYGADVPGRNFEAFMAKMIANEKSYNGWSVAGSKITPNWAEYWSSNGGRQLRVKVLSSCGGKQAVVTRFEFSRNMLRDVERVERSLKAGPAHSCK
ncbi:hypothetical protein MNBD_ALPHA12-550 [hydrothermal vent metagenome]|uniref:Uncharacterized protein n=1 Tax=hydrothermal vent metagenome TaxID=652676 RepID=A0A3B0TYK6_9ZZZZ